MSMCALTRAQAFVYAYWSCVSRVYMCTHMFSKSYWLQ